MASMQTHPFAVAAATRSAVLASSDLSFRQRVRETLSGLRWQVREAGGGAEALALLEAAQAEALILDSWLPDLEIREFVREFERLHPQVDLIAVDGTVATGARGAVRSPRRNELLHALRSGQDGAPAEATFSILASKPEVEPGTGSGSQAGVPGVPFSGVFQDAMSNLKGLEEQASSTIEGLVAGRGVDVHAAMIATQKSDLAFEMALAVRGKLVAAYQTVMGVQF